MSNTLNSDQLRSVVIVLRMFEESLRKAENWLNNSQAGGILYQSTLELSAERQTLVRQKIGQALEQIGRLAHELELQPEKINPAGLIRGEMSVCWANLVDSQSARLRRFGAVNPALAQTIDPTMQQLAQLALELATLFETDSTERGITPPPDGYENHLDKE